ncbi:multiubiquitin domain-containing protein [Trinickia mobilis]|uniref:multiubiquitin domain-containing protein n=1 Tax=Trinickia mobilis TaxID=2816356 RepID=UPI001A8FAFE0|nr:multiubiquitin domain-containing protein [Trinickia mobilis]
MTELAHAATYHFFVDGKPYATEKTYLSGLEIKNIAGVAGNYQLYLEEQGDTPDRAISDGETVPMDHKEKHFFAVPPATFGKQQA